MKKPKTPNALLSESRKRLGDPYAYLNDSGTFDLPSETGEASHFAKTLALSRSLRGKQLIKFQIENLATTLLRELWAESKQELKNPTPSPFALLNPEVTIRKFGIELIYDGGLQQFKPEGGAVRTDGWTDRDNNQIGISQLPSVTSRRFTAAHELGHLLMHRDTVMHRDRPHSSGLKNDAGTDQKEREANYFATYLLMPRKLVTSEFHARFGDQIPFELNAKTAFNLRPKNHQKLLENSRSNTHASLATILASATYYSRNHFESLATRFSVSTEAMTYRLIELGLVK